MNVKRIKKILRSEWEDCPYCGNEGFILKSVTKTKTKIGKDGKPKPVPVQSHEKVKCRFCWENDYSVFNQKMIRE